jgi:hypothetical protein
MRLELEASHKKMQFIEENFTRFIGRALSGKESLKAIAGHSIHYQRLSTLDLTHKAVPIPIFSHFLLGGPLTRKVVSLYTSNYTRY